MQGQGASGGDGLGGGVYLDGTTVVNVTGSGITHNQADGGPAGSGGSDGQGIGGGVYALGMFSFDATTVITKNHASTSNDNIFP
jgi:hypothetical protein